MLIPSILAVLALGALATAQSLEEVLLENDFTTFAQELLSVLDPETLDTHVIIYAPSNDALAQRNDTGVSRRVTFATMLQVTSNSSAKLDTTDKRQTVITPGHAYQTWLNDPALVNLGPGVNVTIVERCEPFDTHAVIYSGLGGITNITGEDIWFDGGIVRPVDSYFTVPAPIDETLPVLGLGAFKQAIERTGILDEIKDIPGITVFAPSDEALAAASNISDAKLADLLRHHVAVEAVAYTVLLEDGITLKTLDGTELTVTFEDGAYLINGARIIRGDGLVKNGVVHVLESLASMPAPSPTSPPPEVITGAASAFQITTHGLASLMMAAALFLV